MNKEEEVQECDATEDEESAKCWEHKIINHILKIENKHGFTSRDRRTSKCGKINIV